MDLRRDALPSCPAGGPSLVYGAGLENQCGFAVTVGSNPTPSANYYKPIWSRSC